MKISRNLLLLGLLTLAFVSSVISCKPDEKTEDLIGNWITLNDFIGDARYEAVAFSINEIGYVGSGYNGDDRLKDFYAYDADRNNWTMISTPPEQFAARTGAVAFSAAGKGYVGTGRDNTTELKDFWVYDPGTNEWDSIAPLPVARYDAVAFSIDNKGYVGTGYNGSALLDFYQYDPGTDVWIPIANYPTKVRDAVAFVIDNKGYVCTGQKNGETINDFYMYDPSADTWNVKRKISNVSDEAYDDDYTIVREKAVAFTIGGKGYVTTGNLSGLVSDVWEYDPAADLWADKTAFEGKGRINAVAFSTTSGRGFVATGYNGSSAYYDDLLEFKPLADYNEDD